jgi:hypothetical protein
MRLREDELPISSHAGEEADKGRMKMRASLPLPQLPTAI